MLHTSSGLPEASRRYRVPIGGFPKPHVGSLHRPRASRSLTSVACTDRGLPEASSRWLAPAWGFSKLHFGIAYRPRASRNLTSVSRATQWLPEASPRCPKPRGGIPKHSFDASHSEKASRSLVLVGQTRNRASGSPTSVEGTWFEAYRGRKVVGGTAARLRESAGGCAAPTGGFGKLRGEREPGAAARTADMTANASRRLCTFARRQRQNATSHRAHSTALSTASGEPIDSIHRFRLTRFPTSSATISVPSRNVARHVPQ